MAYTVQQLSNLAGVSVRTLHYYNEVGLLIPAYIDKNGYRYYEEKELMLLQQILFFKELEFPLEKIGEIMKAPHFSIKHALGEHYKLIELKKKRLTNLLKTIQQTMDKIDNQTPMKDDELYGSFNKKEMEEYQAEAKERWGDTNAWKQSEQRYGKLSADEKAAILKAGEDLLTEIVGLMKYGATDDRVQEAIARHYNGLRAFYDPTPDLYKGLGTMYVEDERFAKYFKKFHPELHIFMRDAMHYFIDYSSIK